MGPYRSHYKQPKTPEPEPLTLTGLGDDSIYRALSGMKVMEKDPKGYLLADILTIVRPDYQMKGHVSFHEFCEQVQRSRGYFYALGREPHPCKMHVAVYVKVNPSTVAEIAATTRAKAKQQVAA